MSARLRGPEPPLDRYAAALLFLGDWGARLMSTQLSPKLSEQRIGADVAWERLISVAKRSSGLSSNAIAHGDGGQATTTIRKAIAYVLVHACALQNEIVGDLMGIPPEAVINAVEQVDDRARKLMLSRRMPPDLMLMALLSGMSALPVDPDGRVNGRMPIAEIIGIVAEAFGTPEIEIRSQRRSRTVAQARQVAMWLAKQATLSSLPEIGRHFADRDHTTVIHAVNKIDVIVTKMPKPGDVSVRGWALAFANYFERQR
ncbi:helix-turn-helix domain-containing protein [Terrarubrum flagellatum]|uniref:helix-turn-helix domain-containing protein n=1 Tax=Terrirubrum flagellatum TaxID=2895980 RepID=UPI003144FD04